MRVGKRTAIVLALLVCSGLVFPLHAARADIVDLEYQDYLNHLSCRPGETLQKCYYQLKGFDYGLAMSFDECAPYRKDKSYYLLEEFRKNLYGTMWYCKKNPGKYNYAAFEEKKPEPIGPMGFNRAMGVTAGVLLLLSFGSLLGLRHIRRTHAV